jgi:hypothetical protein
MTNWQAEARRIANYNKIKRVIHYTGVGAGNRKFHTEDEFRKIINKLSTNKNHALLIKEKKIKNLSLPEQVRAVGGVLFVRKRKSNVLS